VSEWSKYETAASELIHTAKRQGVDLEPLCHSWAFFNQGRSLRVWMQGSEVGYAKLGPIKVLPAEFKDSAGAFYGMWCEAGILPNVERALLFLKGWLLDMEEIDQLPVPERVLRRYGISGT
jgi:hypothetical protein